jgi:hypothetical protein
MLLHHVWQHNLTMLLKNGDLPSKPRTSSILTSLKLGFNLLRGGWADLPRTHKISSMRIGLLEAAVYKIRALSDSLDILLPWDNTLHLRLVEIILSLPIMIARIDIKRSCGIIQVTWIFIDRSWDVFNVWLELKLPFASTEVCWSEQLLLPRSVWGFSRAHSFVSKRRKSTPSNNFVLFLRSRHHTDLREIGVRFAKHTVAFSPDSSFLNSVLHFIVLNI